MKWRNQMEHTGNNSPAAAAASMTEARRDAFSTTHWSVVLAVREGDVTGSAAALEKLCQRYWHPIYAFIRRRGSNPHEAEDLTQAFFAHLLAQETLKKVAREKRKFRTFLLAALTHFLANEWDKCQTLKRGGQRQIFSLDEARAEELYGYEPVEPATPDKLFDRRWAWLLVEAVLSQLQQEYHAANKAELFAKLEPGLTGELNPGWHAGLAAEVGMNAGAVRVALFRLRRRFGELLRGEIAQTVSSAAEVDEEIRQLFTAMSA